ncbi:branched-chain amino acid ABC transporter permease [Acidisphaera rubrifaciens]|uniref:ABC transporter n=1 Tax=Acidisphaera rubrifaciens HS-AP3 TaxID=1231350 RepID=A0A0D6P8D7_9PROT|nr:branched-chain amino acid ABC transporter permease [Acidisphaera rubrifaciens]GAN77932.1 ABC transporter [Acidisphaera rubrifaciens HS-AP3]
MRPVDVIVQGVLVGGLYTLFATGLSLIFGVMRLVNLAHGDLIVLGAYMGIVTTQALGLSPFASLLVVVPAMAALGYALQRLLLNRTLGDDPLPPLLVTFGLSIVIQNALLEGFTADDRKLAIGSLATRSLALPGGIAVGWFPLIVLACAIAVIAGLQALLYRTAWGAALRATSDDPVTVRLMGVDQRHMYAMAMAVALAVCGVAGVLLACWTNVDPGAGPQRLLYGFEAVIIGGLGSLWGTLAGGLILGIAQAVGAAIDPAFQILAGHLAFLLVLLIAPRGLLPRMAA